MERKNRAELGENPANGQEGTARSFDRGAPSVSHQEATRHEGAVKPATADLDGWEFGPPDEPNDRTANVRDGPTRTEPVVDKRSDDERFGDGRPIDEGFGSDRPAADDQPSDDLDEWTFGVTNAEVESADRSVTAVGSAEPTGDTESIEAESGIGSGTVSAFERRLAPVVGALVALSLLLSGGYILVVTVW